MASDVATPRNTARQSFTPIPDAKQPGGQFEPLPDESKDGWVQAHARQTILVEPQALYELWHDESKFPLWQEHVVSVTPGPDATSHWVMGNPDDPEGKRVEFDSQLVQDLPGEKIAWKSISGDVEQSGEVEFAARRDGRGTVVTLTQRFKMGRIANAAATVANRGPKQTVIEDLRHFKQMAEAGEIPSVVGQPHGPRSLSGSVKEWMYGETNPTPPGTSVEVEATA